MSLHRVNLSIERSYSPTWQLWEGVREMVQNWYDGLLETRESLRKTIYVPKLEIEKSENSEERTVEYNASVDLPSGGLTTRRDLGKVCYSAEKKCLTLVNHKTELARKVLLLGYTKKPHCEDVIGEFGEGLKIGALALYREGRRVTVETKTDRWCFTVDHHKSFKDSRVLTVIVSDRNETVCDELCDFPTCPLLNLGPEDTCTTISPITEKEWEQQTQRFLFLEPPLDSVNTDKGRLMMDTHLAGQLYVRGVWVTDMKTDDLVAGVDFYRMRLDRDRRAVVHKSDIDHQVSSMWTEALEKKPEWASRYYRLLHSGGSCDVRHASFYMQEATTASLVAKEFFKQNGQNALPLINTATNDLLRKFTHDLKKQVVLCNQSLLEILIRSGKVQTADSLLDQHKVSQQVKIPLAKLSDDEMGVLRHVQDLVNIVDPNFNLSSVDIIETEDQDLRMTSASRIEIPHWMLDKARVAVFFPKAATEDFELWREAQLASWILSRVKLSQDWLNGRADFSVQGGSIVFAALATQSQGKAKPFCYDRHKSGVQETDKSMWIQREAKKDKQIQQLLMDMHEQEEEHRQALNELMSIKRSLEKQLRSKEHQHVDVRQELEHHYQKLLDMKLGEAEATVQESRRMQKKLEENNEKLAKKNTWGKEQYDEMKVKLEKESTQRRTTEDHLKDLMLQLKQQLRVRLEDYIQEMNRADDHRNDKVLKFLQKIADKLKELEEKKDITCVVCKQNDKSHILVPCGHFSFCEGCAETLCTAPAEQDRKCPVCRVHVEKSFKVFSS
ncbi:uncharacterized protein LOC134193825 isoform X1 [Corticium candelabrum]|uniref:uncharacterized protein LOC134193825 isoform X1 n=1 Tax=Corticium candelabrum TaxID=121492 RepID=UPI002E26D8D6|nr:uncharacterized protein LOC134193825 isoform X1 [Corticium candelabrum]